MTNPQPSPAPPPNGEVSPPPQANSGSVSSAWRGVQGMNRWVLLGIVAVILLLVWYFYVHRADSTDSQSSENGSNDWESKARSLLSERGYPQAQIDSAMTHYLHGGQMSTQDLALVSVAIRELGTPDIPNPAPSGSYSQSQSPFTNPGPATPSGTSQNSSSNELATDSSDPVLYVYFTSAGFGWTSSLRGISAQLYGSANYAASLLQYNPTITSVSARIPPGVRIKAPRTLNV